jgi:uncharacterized protein YprB with RNaseH-like and TPR domain
MGEDLRKRLRELGVVRGPRELPSSSPRRQYAIEALVPGRFRTTSRGQCFVVETAYSPDHLHGDLQLCSFLDLPPEATARIARDGTLAGLDPRRFCFLDTETTGLSGGTGTMAFVVGLGYFSGGRFSLAQYFLRDPGDEPAMIETLAELLSGFDAVISFNGRAFDVPILETRFILARTPPPTAGMPHLDLLPPARSLWRHSLPSCSLGTLEREVLGVVRDQDDVPSGVIPYLYRDYLRTGDARDMQRVVYHNAVDILSMVTLAARLCWAFASPWEDNGGTPHEGLNGPELYGLGRCYAADGQPAEAERAYRAALRSGLSGTGSGPHVPDLRARALLAMGYLLKRSDRRGEALAYWQQLALESAPDTADHILAHVELAKYFEWTVGDLSMAARWTRAALVTLENWPAGVDREARVAELRHRMARLERKLAKLEAQDGGS